MSNGLPGARPLTPAQTTTLALSSSQSSDHHPASSHPAQTDSRDPALTLNPIPHQPAPACYPAPHYHTHTPQTPIQDVEISNALLLAMSSALERMNFKQHSKIRTLKAWLPAGPLCLAQDPLFAHLIHALVHNSSNTLDPLTPRLHPPASSTKTQPAQATHKTPPPARTKFLNPLEIE
ncbi:hypothetical protein PtB15_9B673 [Puccinia triticina]|nr:hypothetical protein PtB15_9B673 [Puccinia triticina]